MKTLKLLMCLCLCVVLWGCEKTNLELIHEQFTVELGQSVISDVSCYLDMDNLSEKEKRDIQKYAKFSIEDQKNVYNQVGKYLASIEYKQDKVDFYIHVQDTTFPIIHAPAYLYTSLKQPIDYKKVIHVEDQNLQRLVIDDEEVNIDKIGEYPLHIMAYDETGNCVKQDIKVKVASSKPDLPTRIKLDVPYYNQMDVNAPNGCEATALYMALKYKNKVHIDLKAFIQGLPQGETPYLGFAGDPFQNGQHSYDYYTVFPSALVHYATQYQPTYDISGYSVDEIKQELSEDHPVIVWLTSGMNDPIVRHYYFGNVVGNLHIVLLNGYDDNKQIFYVQDPIDHKIKTINYKQFLKIYNEMKLAVSVH